MTEFEALRAELKSGEVHLVPFNAQHLEPLRSACAEDADIWEIYPYPLIGEPFDKVMDMLMKQLDAVMFAILKNDEVVGKTTYLRPDPRNGVVEIGGTYIAPRVRGTGLNRAMKKLLIEHAFAQGFGRIEFRVDERNKRSQAALLKLGAMREGMLRRNMVTWTGHVRNTCVFGLLRDEWQG